MTQKNTGGPAFPIAPEGAYIPDCKDPDNPPAREFPGHPGMTLRDYFAGQALAGLMTHKAQLNRDLVVIAYDAADSMIEARDK